MNQFDKNAVLSEWTNGTKNEHKEIFLVPVTSLKMKSKEPTLHLLSLVSSHQTADEADVEEQEDDADDANEEDEQEGHFFLGRLNRRHSARSVRCCKIAFWNYFLANSTVEDDFIRCTFVKIVLGSVLKYYLSSTTNSTRYETQ